MVAICMACVVAIWLAMCAMPDDDDLAPHAGDDLAERDRNRAPNETEREALLTNEQIDAATATYQHETETSATVNFGAQLQAHAEAQRHAPAPPQEHAPPSFHDEEEEFLHEPDIHAGAAQQLQSYPNIEHVARRIPPAHHRRYNTGSSSGPDYEGIFGQSSASADDEVREFLQEFHQI